MDHLNAASAAFMLFMKVFATEGAIFVVLPSAAQDLWCLCLQTYGHNSLQVWK